MLNARLPHDLIYTLICLVISLLTASQTHADEANGKRIYRTQCAACHGDKGQGVADQFEQPLSGKRSVAALTKIIADTMPEENPELCVGKDAEDVATFIYHEFYSPNSRLKSAKARVELVRLTANQHRSAIADLLGDAVAGRVSLQGKNGIPAKYFNARGTNSDKLAFKRTDPIIDFDFGTESPDTEKIKSEEFCIFWEGGIRADQTGHYEFIVKTKNGFQFWLNDKFRPVIDGWVADGVTEEHRTTMYLMGGRVYPMKLLLFRLGGDECAVSLKWIPPGGTAHIIPTANLVPDWTPVVGRVPDYFPADDSSVGYERGTQVSKDWDDATTRTAIGFADQVVGLLANHVRHEDGSAEQARAYRETCAKILKFAFRRPLSEQETQFFVERQFEVAENPATAVRRCIILALKSPRFLYLNFGKKHPDQFDVATRLSFALWDSGPDQILLDAAESGNLKTAVQIRRQAERMTADPRCREKIRQFFEHWLETERAKDVSKDQSVFPGFDEKVLADLKTSLFLLLDDVIWSEASDFRQLFQSRTFYANARLAKFYGIESFEGDDFRPVEFEADRRAGILTHPYLMTGLSYHKNTSPIHRGVFVARSLLGRTLNPPPVNVEPLDESFDPTMTTRQRVVHQTKDVACMSCHSVINPLGFSLEHYDAVGRFRDQEKEKPVNAQSHFETLTGETVSFSGAVDLAKFLAENPNSHHSFVEQMFHHIVKQPMAGFGPTTGDQLFDTFSKSEFSVRRLIVESAIVSAMHNLENGK